MTDYSLVAAIASAVAAAGSVLVACFSFRQQRAATRASDIDKNIDRLIALATRANGFFSAISGSERNYNQVANVTNSIDAASCRIIFLEAKLDLKPDEVKDISRYFTDHLSYELIEAMRYPKPPAFKPDGSYSSDDLDYVNHLWRRSCRFFLQGKKPEQPD